MKRSIGFFYLMIVMVMFSACEKVIDVKLDGSATQIVIEGQVTANADKKGDHWKCQPTKKVA